jgi:hypothetical protein
MDNRSDHFMWGKGIVWSQCSYCSRKGERQDVATCTAFPGGIPQIFLSNRADHRVPWIDPATGEPGDTGARGTATDPSILFDPRPGVSPDVLADLYRKLDRIPG